MNKQLCRIDCCCESCIMKHVALGCSYGQPSGPDDYINDCECGE